MLVSKPQTSPSSRRNNQKKSPVEHVLLRPDSYVGSLEALKIRGDEILVNAADNKVRDDKMNLIKVDIDEEGGQIPSLITEKESLLKCTRTKNSITEFILETVSKAKKYRKTFRNNMIVIEQPILTTCSKNAGDYKLHLYVSDREDLQSSLVYDKCGDRWEMGPFLPLSLNSIIFVNTLCTTKGGAHVNYIADKLAERIMIAVKNKNKNAKTKENLTLKVASFGSTCDSSDAFFNK
ncbi:12625_t:CDS:2, partial [Funneliformis mosseae]